MLPGLVALALAPIACGPGIATGTLDAGTRDGAILVRLNAPPVDGAANAELIEMLAAALDRPRRDVTIIAGERGRTKRVRVSGIALDTALARLGR